MKKSEVNEAIKAVLADGWVGSHAAMASLSRRLKLDEPEEESTELRLDGYVERVSYTHREHGGMNGKVFVVVPQTEGECPARVVFPVGSLDSIDRWLSRYHSLKPVTVKVTFEGEKEEKMEDEKWKWKTLEEERPKSGQLIWFGNYMGALLEPVRWSADERYQSTWTHWLPVALPTSYPDKPLSELDEGWHWFGISGPHGPSIAFSADPHDRMAQIVDGNVVCTGTIPKSVVAALLEAHS